MIIGSRTTPQRSSVLGRTSKQSTRHAIGADPTSLKKRRVANPYEYGISFYEEPPEGEVNLEEAECYVHERIKILSIVSSLEAPKNNPKDYFTKIKEELSKIKVDQNSSVCWALQTVGLSKGNQDVRAARRRDHVSHYLCRLYFCRTSELRKWFVDQEVELMRMRLFDICSSEALNFGTTIEDILGYNGFDCDPVPASEINTKDFLFKYRSKPTPNHPELYVGNKRFYKFPFEETVNLMARRRVVIKQGFSYVDSSELASILQAKYRHFLNKSLIDLFLVLSDLGEEERLLPRIGSIHEQVKKELTASKMADSVLNNSFRLTREQIPSLSNQHFPPCMKHLNQELTDKSHLKHFARLHFGLFLKGLGLPVEEALLFFREQFTKSGAITPEQFQKNYAYNIRHVYGLEGARKDLSAYSCAKIQNQSPGPGECHGCPFKHMDQPNLSKLISSDGVTGESASEILSMTKENNPSGACLKYFASTRGYLPRDGSIYHPNQFFVASKRGPVVATQQQSQLQANLDNVESNGIASENDTLVDSINGTTSEADTEIVKKGDNDEPLDELAASLRKVTAKKMDDKKERQEDVRDQVEKYDQEVGMGGGLSTICERKAKQKHEDGADCKMDLDKEPVTASDQSLAPSLSCE